MTDNRTSSGYKREGEGALSEETLSKLPIEADDGPVFEAPWQARAFAIAVVLSDYKEGVYTWKDFQGNLVREVQSETDVKESLDDAESSADISGSEAVYYGQWLRALEQVLLKEGLVDPDEMRHRVREFADGDRDASEFVEGDHNHDHTHLHLDEHDHSHGSTEP